MPLTSPEALPSVVGPVFSGLVSVVKGTGRCQGKMLTAPGSKLSTTAGGEVRNFTLGLAVEGMWLLPINGS